MRLVTESNWLVRKCDYKLFDFSYDMFCNEWMNITYREHDHFKCLCKFWPYFFLFVSMFFFFVFSLRLSIWKFTRITEMHWPRWFSLYSLNWFMLILLWWLFLMRSQSWIWQVQRRQWLWWLDLDFFPSKWQWFGVCVCVFLLLLFFFSIKHFPNSFGFKLKCDGIADEGSNVRRILCHFYQCWFFYSSILLSAVYLFEFVFFPFCSMSEFHHLFPSFFVVWSKPITTLLLLWPQTFMA